MQTFHTSKQSWLPRLLWAPAQDLGLLFLRLSGALLLLYVHGLPKIINFAGELQHIDDPLHVGRAFTLGFAIFAEVLCPVLIVPGILTRLASAAVLFLLAVSMFLVHADWSVAEGQFGWLLMIVFGGITLMGAGRYSIDAALAQKIED
ncbi:DoxX family protein [Herbaspirillum sp. RV1423]|uniref:DoxX family protein n=1 Tax=Herbaspirillum sp. RV1423 TaxID=1443993 RepID=UPI0004B52965|nr:DoxX family protein [Herbaspirillum sp. RV1423]